MKIIIALFAGIFLLQCLSSCASKEDDGIKDALKISAYLFNENTSEPIEWDDKTVFTLEQLQLNKPRIMAPIWAMDMANLNIYFEFEGGIIEVTSENRDIQLSVDDTLKPWYIENDFSIRTFGFNINLTNKGFISAGPVGSGFGSYLIDDLVRFEGYIGREYYLTVNAYTLDNDKVPVIKAKLKLIQLEDISEEARLTDGKGSHCFSIELIAYEYSDTYKMMEE